MTTRLTDNALKRRIKKYFPKENLELFIPCPTGMVKLAKQDLSCLNLKINCIEGEGLAIKGDWQTVYSLNLFSRIGSRVLVRVAEFYVGSYPELFQKLNRIHWEVFIGKHESYTLKVSAKKSRLHHTGNIAKTFDDCIKSKMKSFEIDVANNIDSPIVFYVRFFQDRCQVSIDTSGEHLHKRGYRQFVGKAPMRENLVSGLLQFAGNLPEVLVDPFCGSGTIAFEYIFLKWNQAPGLLREFSFERFPYFQKKRWDDLKLLAKEKVKKCPLKVYLNDVDELVIDELKKEIDRLELNEQIIVNCSDYKDFLLELNITKEFILISNLPYGKRIEIPTKNLFKELKRLFAKWQKNLRFGLMMEKGMRVDFEEVFSSKKTELGNKSLKFKNGGINTYFLTRNND